MIWLLISIIKSFENNWMTPKTYKRLASYISLMKQLVYVFTGTYFTNKYILLLIYFMVMLKTNQIHWINVFSNKDSQVLDFSIPDLLS